MIGIRAQCMPEDGLEVKELQHVHIFHEDYPDYEERMQVIAHNFRGFMSGEYPYECKLELI